MDEDTIQDLKQFISTTISQQVADVRSDIRVLDGKLSSKMDDLSKSVAEALDTSNEATEAQLREHESRITRLERKIA